MANRRLTHEEFVKRVEAIHPNMYEFLGEYQTRVTPIRTRFKACGHEEYLVPHNILTYTPECKICGTGTRMSHEEFVNNLEKRYPNEYELLSEYKGSHNSIHVRDLLCGLDWWTKPYNVYTKNARHPDYSKQLLSQKKSLSNEGFNEKFKEIAPKDYLEYEFLDDYINNSQTMHIKHNCGYEYTRRVSSILYEHAYKCPKCHPKSYKGVMEGINDIHTTNSYLESILKNKEDAFRYSQFSHAKTWFICPQCGNEIYSDISNVASSGSLSCPCCSTNISFAERFMNNLLRKLNVNFEYQFSPDWINPRRYDFQLNIDDKQYILEIDGSWHVLDNNLSGMTAEQQQEIDEYKENEAIKHGYDVIRLDYKYSSTTRNKEVYLKQSLFNSPLYSLLGLSEDIIDQIMLLTKNNKMISNHVYNITKVWNNLDNKNMRNLMANYKLNNGAMRKYLYQASEMNLINESIDEIKKLNYKSQFKNGKDTRAHYAKCDQTGEILNYSEAREKYRANLFRYFQDENYIHTGKLPDGTKLTWTKVENNN